MVGAQYDTDNEEFSCVLRSLQNLDLDGGTKKRARARRVGTEFASHYGSDAHVTERWQALCRDCGVNPVPPSIGQCKKVQRVAAFEGDHGPLEICILGLEICGPLTLLRGGKKLGSRLFDWTNVRVQRELLKKRPILIWFIKLRSSRFFLFVSESENCIQIRSIRRKSDLYLRISRRFLSTQSKKNVFIRLYE